MTPPRTIQIIFNPQAGGAAAAQAGRLEARLEALGACVITGHSGPGTTCMINSAADLVCVLGGDGTLRHVAAALRDCGRRVPLSILPGGTINLVHREILSPVAIDAFARHLLSDDPPRLHYSAVLGDTLFLACASCGPDSAAVAAVSNRTKRLIGRFAYATAFARVLLFDWRRPAITLRHDHGTTACEAFYVAKGRFFAGPWSFAPSARLDDPLLSVVALPRARRRDFVRFCWQLWRGLPLTGTISFTCSWIEATADMPARLQADGDIVAALPVSIRLDPEPCLFR